MTPPAVFLKKNHEAAFLPKQHPWIFASGIARGDATTPGETVDVRTSAGDFVARGTWNPRSALRVRVWTWNDEPIDRGFFTRRLAEAAALRRSAGLDASRPGAPTDAFRLVHAEADRLPGLVVDAYAGFLVVQFNAAGVEHHRAAILDALEEAFRPAGILEKSDAAARAREGLGPAGGLLRGTPPPAPLEIREDGLVFLVNLPAGQKTGFYLDQRENRRNAAALVRTLPAESAPSVLNLFSYTGAFGVHAAAARPGTRVLNVDSSEEALTLSRRNFERNALADRTEHLEADAFRALRDLAAARRQFSLVITDPPKFARGIRDVPAALKGYRDLNRHALAVVAPGGYLATFSCSGAVSPADFEKTVLAAARETGAPVQILARPGAPADHPVPGFFPEAGYLKGLVLKKMD
ncbi:MAG: class I SAM-dependent rRNA methyltransferase [Planctomycetota bacterium]